MPKLNNVDMESLGKTLAGLQADPEKGRRTQVSVGEWLFDPEGPQYRGELSFEGGKLLVETDQPTGQGGGGSRPGPMHYCFYALGACYTTTFATIAAMMGVKLEKLACRVEADMNMAPVFGVAEGPINEGVRIILTVKADAPREKLQEIEELARARCPAAFTLSNPITLEARLEVEG